jgi:hypothetical protein
MSTRMLRCLHCGGLAPVGSTYCPFCGEPIAPALIAELQWLFGALNDLDTRIARGEGEHSLTTLRDEYRERYFAARHAPVAEKPAASVSPAVVPAAPAPLATPATATPTATFVPSAPAASVTVAPTPYTEPRPAGPVFSWQAFLSEQAIAIMMYMGGFLGLVAMLSFEIGGWQSLDLRVKLGAIILVYVAFGVLGFMMRRLPRLHTVGGAYLGVFALMTPLLALGIYRFGLQSAGFSGAAMLSLSSAYAAIVYLALAWRTRFMTYAYLGWSAMILAALAVVFWVDAPRESLIFALALISLALLLPGIAHRFPLAAQLETPALQLAAVTSIAAVSGTLFLWLALAIRAVAGTPLAISSNMPPPYSTAVYALSACTLVLVASVWSTLARRLTSSLEETARTGRLNVTDWLIVAAATQATIAVPAWLGADRRAMSIVLAALALAEVAALFILWRRARERAELRYLVEALALLVAIGGCLGVLGDPAPNWPYLLALTTGVAVTAGLAIFESAPLWLLPAGVFLSLDYHALIDALFHQTITDLSTAPEHAFPFWTVATTVLVVVLVVPWLVAAPSPLVRRFAAPVYMIALGNALYATINLFGHDPVFATFFPGLYILLALVAGWRAHQPLAGGLVAGFFGVLLPLPLSFAGSDGRFVLGAAITAVVVALVALGIRAALGRASALPIYLIALWTALVAGLHTLANPTATATWSFLGIALSVWLLLVFALLATIAILWDNLPWALFIPALFGLIATVATPGLHGVALTVALAAAGMLLRQLRGHWHWSIAWYIAALFASLLQLLVAIIQAIQSTVSPDRPVYVALVFALVAYVAAVVERQPWLTVVVPVYVFIAAITAREPQSFVKTLAITYGVMIVGLALRRSIGRRWALACYLSTILPSILAVLRATPNTHGVIEALLLIFAITAYGIALTERAPVIGVFSVAYTWFAAIVQPDAHALLPLALVLALIGIAIGRAGGWRWAWPTYASSLAVAMMTAYYGLRLPGFEGWVLLALALVAYLVAMIESRAEVIPLAMLLGVLAVAAGANALGWPFWQAALSFVALSWFYTAGQWVWGTLPWLRTRPGRPWWIDAEASAATQARWQDVRFLGRTIHHAAGLFVGSGVVLAGLLAQETYLPHEALAQVEVVALVSLALMVAFSARMLPLHVLWYVAGGLLAIAVSWQVRWLGADNIQAFVLAPGSYLLIIGALLPADHRLRNPARFGQMASLVGALLLLLPTLTQSFTTAFSENWLYAAILAMEALAIAAIGVGTHARVLLLLGTGFFGLAAIRGALLAFSSGVPVALIIAALALLLMGTATWLSLRVRRETGPAHL